MSLRLDSAFCTGSGERQSWWGYGEGQKHSYVLQLIVETVSCEEYDCQTVAEKMRRLGCNDQVWRTVLVLADVNAAMHESAKSQDAELRIYSLSIRMLLVSKAADMSNPTSTGGTHARCAGVGCPSGRADWRRQKLGDSWRWRLSRVSAKRSRILETVKATELWTKVITYGYLLVQMYMNFTLFSLATTTLWWF